MDSCEDKELEEILAIQQREENLMRLMQETGCEIVQENGQRRFGGPPPNWEGPPPPKGCEIFVGRIPRDVFEDELYRIFVKIGPIYELRLMMDFSGSNRGFAFIQYANKHDAKRAIQEMNDYELRPKHKIGVLKSTDNCRLFIGGIPKNKSQQEIQAEMERLTEGVTKVIVYSCITDKSKNRGFAFVEYVNHRAASKARRKLIPDRIQLWGKEIAVDWAAPESEIDEDVMSKVTVIYVRNLSLTTTEQVLRDIFNRASDNDVQKLKMMRDFAFVHFSSREKAEKAMRIMNHAEINGTRIETTWAKPVKDKTGVKSKPPSRKTSVASVTSNSSRSAITPSMNFTFPTQLSGLLPSSVSSLDLPVAQFSLPTYPVMPQQPSSQFTNSVYSMPPPFHGNFQSSSTNIKTPVQNVAYTPSSYVKTHNFDLNGNRNHNIVIGDNVNRTRKTGDHMMYTNFGPPLHSQQNLMAEERSRAGTLRDPAQFQMEILNDQFNKLNYNNFNRSFGLNGNMANHLQMVNPFQSRPMMP